MRPLFILIAPLFIAFQVHAQSFLGEGVFKKQQQKESVRWTLADWMTQKKQFKMMDHWLALNKSKDIFELNIQGGQTNYDYTVGGNVSEHSIDHWSVAFYWSIFGLQYTVEESDEDWSRKSAQFNLRIFGTSSQDTYLTIFGGSRTWEYENPPNELKQTYAGAKANIYVLSFFGLEGEYKKYFRASDNSNIDYESDRIEYGAFVDLVFVRIYGGVYKETNTTTNAGVSQEDTREGSQAGVQFYL